MARQNFSPYCFTSSRSIMRSASPNVYHEIFVNMLTLRQFCKPRRFSTVVSNFPEAQHSHEEEPTTDFSLKLKPREVVEQLGNYIIGQEDAKRAVAIALRNRWRRQQVSPELRPEISPKNILMIGPTGCGKTEIARRIAKLSEAPFVKVEATKFTEVGYHGRDVDQILRDLVESAIAMVKKARKVRYRKEVQQAVEQRILRALLGDNADQQQQESFLTLLREGELEDRKITIEDERGSGLDGKTFDISLKGTDLAKIFESVRPPSQKTMTIAEARPVLEENEMEGSINMNDVIKEAIEQVEENGIVFIDEIDKVCTPSGYRSGSSDASNEGVQRDLLPIIEGSIVSTKHGNVNTEHILFIASGAFHAVKPSDLLAEFQGRLPIRVELDALTTDDLYRILTEPVANLIRQQVALIKTEGIDLQFTDAAIHEIARISTEMNQTIENIGARRLHTVVERVVEDVSFNASELNEGDVYVIDKELVTEKVGTMLKKSDLQKFIL